MKTLLVLALIPMSIVPAFSQRVDLQLSGGFGFAAAGAPTSSYTETYSTDASGYTVTTIQNRHDTYISLGQGARGEARLIFYLDSSIAIFTGVTYSASTQTSKINSFFLDLPPIGRDDNLTMDFDCGSLQAGLQVQSHEGILEPFVAVGAGYFLRSSFTVTEDNSYTHTDTKVTTNTPIGFVAYLGVNIRIAPKVSLFAAGKATLVSYRITRTEITNYWENHVNSLSSLTTSDRITVYEQNKDYTADPYANTDMPTNGGPPIPIPTSSIALLAGVSLEF